VEARRVPEIDDPGGAVAGPMSPGISASNTVSRGCTPRDDRCC